MLFNAFGGIFRGLGDSRTPLLLMIVACAVNVVGDIVLVAFLGMGAGGAAAATVLAQCVSVIFAFILVRRNGIGFETDRNEMRPGRRETGMILMYGLPVAAQEALTGVSFMVILAILNSFGLNESAGVGIAEKICAIMFLVPVAFMSSVSAFTAQNIGAGKRDRARRAMFDSALFTVLSGLVMFSVSFFLGRELSSLFTDDTAVMAASADYLRSYSIDCILVGINFSVMGYLSGRGKTAAVALQGILSTFLVRIPFSYAMSRIPGVSLFQIGFATPLATLFAIVFDAFLLIHYDRKEKCV